MEENKNVELTEKELEKKAKAEARVLAYQNARTLVRGNVDAIFGALKEHEFFMKSLLMH
jgi:hypothetical protein